MKSVMALCAAAALCAFLAPAGYAQDSSQPDGTTSFGYSHGFGDTQHYNACSEDYAKFCGDVSKYGMRQCLLDHQFDYSPGCKEERKQAAEAARDAAENLQGESSDHSQSPPDKNYLSGQ